MKTKSIITMFLMLVFVIGVLIAVLFAFRDRNVEQKDEEISNIEIKPKIYTKITLHCLNKIYFR